MPSTGRGLEIGVRTGRFAEPLGIRIGVELARAMAEMDPMKAPGGKTDGWPCATSRT